MVTRRYFCSTLVLSALRFNVQLITLIADTHTLSTVPVFSRDGDFKDVQWTCRGGIVFAATQALGWGLFSGSLVCLIYLVTTAARGMAYCIRCWIFATGSVMLASQLVSPLLYIR